MFITVVLRTIFFYFFSVLIFRVMGKREVGQLGVIDLIVSIMIAELAILSVENYEKSILYAVIPILIIVGIQLLFAYISLKSISFRNFFDGKPSVIIENGKINFKEMSKQRYNLDDLIGQLREKSIQSLEEIDYAVLENNGNLSVFKKKQDFPNEYPMPIIVDGRIQHEVLEKLGKNEVWIYNLLKKQHLKLEHVFYAFYTKKKTYIIKTSELKK